MTSHHLRRFSLSAKYDYEMLWLFVELRSKGLSQLWR